MTVGMRDGWETLLDEVLRRAVVDSGVLELDLPVAT